ncbi:hypothetical protein APHMUC_0802 [Anaplasma phagocytophilum str. ApMUC09]|uniref:Uncharacterized protein n=1 Tax=Anaplasma phagocytophilum str. ApMUC09 TaxID=1359152 RepID=A0A0F3NB41_ANAPH|nr:hypothetical protein APHMUC_0802 [Anaplasma phagocytophilum str. ApMUC09]
MLQALPISAIVPSIIYSDMISAFEIVYKSASSYSEYLM